MVFAVKLSKIKRLILQIKRSELYIRERNTSGDFEEDSENNENTI